MTCFVPMPRSLLCLACCVIVAHGSWQMSSAAERPKPTAADLQLARSAQALLQKYCHRCHGIDRQTPGLDVLDVAALVKPIEGEKLPFIKPGEPNSSRLYLKMIAPPGERMPPKDEPRPTDPELQIIRDWITAGAIPAESDRPARPLRGEAEIVDTIARDLNLRSEDARPHTRYFSLLHLWNDSQLSDDDLRLVRAAVSKLLNSLSDQPQIMPPRIVDPQAGLLLAIDLRHYGWQRTPTRADSWSRLLAAYPYGLLSNTDAARYVHQTTGVELPYLRADWFVFHAARPPLYYDLLRLPAQQREVENLLQVDFEGDFARNELQRAGFRRSGVSKNNRVVQRQLIPRVGANAQRTYWSSYDFADDLAGSDALARPLGPPGPGRSLEQAFVHAGGEMIYHLPNFLSGYFLVDARGERIEEGPINIVNDPDQFSGSPAVVNGVSCFGCHAQGYRAAKDTLRETFARDQTPLGNKVRKLYPPVAQLDDLLQQDQRLYLQALETATLSFLRLDEKDRRLTTGFPEPITQVSTRYGRDLDLNKVGRELLLADAKPAAPPASVSLAQFQRKLEDDQFFHVLGLTPLATGEIVDRLAWESLFQRAARALELGTPQLLAGAERFSNSIDMQLVRIPVGKAWLGSPPEEVGRNFDEELRQVDFPRAFYLGMLEVTQDEYLRVMKTTPSFFSNVGARGELVKNVKTGRLPVEKVSALDAEEFCRRLSELPAEQAAGRRYRLPKQDEWEYACRAGARTPFHTGQMLTHVQARFGSQPLWPAVCASFAPNAFGLFDMHGNVSEWCDEGRKVPGAKNPERSLRGGSWRSSANQCRAAARMFLLETSFTDQIGFRVVCEMTDPAAN
jgi:formylglycine-generating enzyme required for sulfatase activity/mono/diheme cytochrome c family protein